MGHVERRDGTLQNKLYKKGELGKTWRRKELGEVESEKKSTGQK